MRVDAIRFEQEVEGALPAEVTVTMSATEAAQICGLLGEMSDADFTRRGWPMSVPSMYEVLSRDVFNRYYEDGVANAIVKK